MSLKHAQAPGMPYSVRFYKSPLYYIQNQAKSVICKDGIRNDKIGKTRKTFSLKLIQTVLIFSLKAGIRKENKTEKLVSIPRLSNIDKTNLDLN